MNQPFILFRLGSNAEKKYGEKMGPYFSGYIARANFFETSPGLLTGLFLTARNQVPDHGYVIDPVTYVYGLGPGENSVRSWQKARETDARTRLSAALRIPEHHVQDAWIREIANPGPTDDGKVEILNIRRSYRALADHYLGTLSDKAGMQAIEPSDITSATASDLTEKVVSYQCSALASRLPDQSISGAVPPPSIVLSPYFMIDDIPWWNAMKTLWDAFESLRISFRHASVLHVTPAFLESSLGLIRDYICSSAGREWAIWIDDTEEEDATETVLQAYYDLVKAVSNHDKTIFNLYGGFFSLCLTSYGLSGLCNGPGYGEHKSAEPITTGPVPAKIYVPPLCKRLSVAKAYDILQNAFGPMTYLEYETAVCPCSICRLGLQENGLANLIPYYGEIQRTLGQDGRYHTSSTARAIERVRYHFLLQRISEYKRITPRSPAQTFELLEEISRNWPGARHHIAHIQRWINVLRSRA